MAPGGGDNRCVAATGHTWGEWRYSEAHAGAVRTCDRCGATVDRSGAAVGSAAGVTPAGATQAPSGPAAATAVAEALGGSIFCEEGKGDYALAAGRGDALLAALQHPDARADAALLRATVHLLQGEPAPASALAQQVLGLASPDANRSLRALSHALYAMHLQFNSFPDGNGVGAVEVSARWQGATDMRPLDERWQDAMRRSTDPAAQLESWLLYSFLGALQSTRSVLEGSRYAPSALPREQVMALALQPAAQLREMATAGNAPALAAFADWAAADLHRRAGDVPAARTLLDRALASYRAAGDRAGQALCLMTLADWTCAPFSSPLSWNLAVVDSSSAASNLSVQLEAAESAGSTDADYDEAERLFAAAGAARGLAAIQLRRCYLATLRDDWAGAAAHAAQAADGFARNGDHRGAQLARTHRLMCQLSGATVPGVDPLVLAGEAGTWGATSGSFSFALGLGILVNRLSRHWLVRRGHYERALACSRAAQALFESLGAAINVAQCRVDQGVIHQAVGERTLALTFFERALDEYTALIAAHAPVADNLRQRVIFLASDVYQLALQQTDSDGMERAAARLEGQLAALPRGASVEETLQRLLGGMTNLVSGTADAATLADAATQGAEFAALRQMAESFVRQSAVLAPMYRARAERRRGQDAVADKLLQQATDALPGLSGGDEHFLHAAVLAERRDYRAAAEAMRRHVRAGGADAGFTGQLTELMKTYGGAHGAAEAALQQRRTHEQAFAAFVMVRAYDDAWEHLQALERLGGPEWWKADARPWQPLCDIGEVHEARGGADRALECYDRAIEQLESRRGFLSRDELKVALASDKGAQYLYFLAARAAVKAGDASRGFDYAERGKARALLDLMAAARANATDDEDDETRAWRESSMRLVLHRGLLAQARVQRPPDAGRIAALEAQVAEEEATVVAAERHLTRRNPRAFEALGTSAAPMRAGEVRRLLRPGTALVEYFFLGEDLLAWAVTRDAGPIAHHAAVRATALALDIVRFHRACEHRAAWASKGADLARVLLEPLAGIIRQCEHLVFVPHGAAHALPFHALPFDGVPLAVHRSVSYLPSASVLQWLTDDGAEALPDRILVVGNPTRDLPAARGEAEFVARQFPQAVLLMEDAATEEAVRAEIAKAPLLHFATHGTLDEETPLNSSIELAEGGQLTVYELMLMRLHARLVVLSACSTAQGETTGGDDVLGLTRGLLAAGARAALVSLWPVDDRSTALLMEEFYRQLRAGVRAPEALRAAQNHLRELGAGGAAATSPARHLVLDEGDAVEEEDGVETGYSHPYHWAPFVLVG